jgi:flagellar assembly protein FliH
MSSYRGFTAEELVRLAPWRLPVVDDDEDIEASRFPEPEHGTVTVVEEEMANVPRLTAEEIEAVQRKAHEEAATRGREEGWDTGYRDGYEAGLKEGLESARTELAERAKRLEMLASELARPLDDLEEAVFEELSALATALARQLIRRELRTDPGQIIAVAREALSALPSGSRKVALHLHPDDVELVRQALFLDEDGQAWRVVEDPLLTRGGCRVITENSTIDASVEKRLAAVIARAFGGERGGDGS